MIAHCTGCKEKTDHSHNLQRTYNADGSATIAVPSTEHWQCCQCGIKTYAQDDTRLAFIFVAQPERQQ